jgi:hypothetical protein
MKKNILLSFIMVFFASSLISQQSFALGQLRQGEYVRDSWTFDNGQTETNKGVAVDSQGNIYVASTITTAIEEWQPVVSENHIIKYNKDGEVLWIKIFVPDESTSLTRIAALVVDSNDNIYATGTIQADNSLDCLTIKYDTAGQQKWSVTFNSQYNFDDKGLDIVVDSAGMIYVVGKSYLDNTFINYTGFMVKYNSRGKEQTIVVNTKNADDPGNENRDVTVDGNNNVYVLNYTQIPDQLYQVSKYNSDLVRSLEYLENIYIAETFGIIPVDITADNAGNLILAGWAENTGENYHKFIKLNDSGAFQCGREDQFTNAGGLHDEHDGYTGVTTDASGNIYLVGTEQWNFLTIKFDSNCVAVWGDGSPEAIDYMLWSDYMALGKAIAVDNDENIYLAGDSYTAYDSQNMPLWDVATVQYFKTDEPFPVAIDSAQCTMHSDGSIAVDITGGPFSFYGTVTSITSYVEENGSTVPVLGPVCSVWHWDLPGVWNVYWQDTKIKAFCDVCPAGILIDTLNGGRGESAVVPLP